MNDTLSHAPTTPPAYPDDDAADEPRRRDVERLLSADALPMSDRLREEARGTAERLFAASKHAPLRPGDRLGAYRVGRLLGLGGQAFVYEATHEALGRRVALKVPRPEVAERVLQEARLTASLEHPNVVRVEDVGSAEVAAGTPGDGAEVPFLVMELCPGGSLDQLLERYPRGLPLPEVRRIATAVLEALSWAHARGVVHRDVKPANVLFDGQGTPKLADLGIGTQATANVDLVHSVSLTSATDGPAGTPLYVAPEQEDPRRLSGAAVDGRADLFSFGKMLFVLLTGASPRTIRPPSRLRTELSPAWDDLVFRLVEEDRGRRYASAADVLAALRAIPDGRTAAAARAPAPPLRALPVPVPASPAAPTFGVAAPTAPPAVVVRSRRAERHGRRSARLLSLAGLFSIGFWVWLVAFKHWGAGPWLGLSLVKTGALTGGLLLLWLARVGRRPDMVGPPLPVALGLAALLAGWAPYVALHGAGLYSRGLLPTAGAGVLSSLLLALVARFTLFRRVPAGAIEPQPEVEVRVRPRDRQSEPQIVVHRRTPFGEALQAVATVIGWSVAAVAVVALGLIVGLVVLGVVALAH
jgi:hypothetical protein